MFKLFSIFVAVLFIKFVCSVSQDIYCRERRNVTFLGFNHDEIDRVLANFVDPCIHVNVFNMYTLKTVSLHSEKLNHFNQRELYYEKTDDGFIFNTDDDVLTIQLLVERTKSSDHSKQTLVHRFFKLTRNVTEQMYNELEKLQENRGWDLLISCSVVQENFPCPLKQWIKPSRLISYHGYYEHRTFLPYLQNPSFDRVQWLKMTEMEIFQKSCFENQKIVINIIFYDGPIIIEPFTFVQRAIAMILHFRKTNKNIRFHFHLASRFGKYHMEFLNNYLQFYGIDDNNTVLFNNQKYKVNVHGIRDIMDFVENELDDKTKNVYLVVLFELYFLHFCDNNKNRLNEVFTEHQMKHLHFSPSKFLSYDIQVEVIPDKCKGLKNIHYKFDIYGGDRFFNAINKMVCKT